jgi:glycosyltransferase involved in cell wall biosynthesis
MKPFTIIIPVYNEEAILRQNVEKLINYANKMRVEYEIIAVSNGSTDKSLDIGKKLETTYPRFRIFGLAEKGVGRAFKKGIAEAKYQNIIFMDADLSADLSFIEKANRLLEGHVLILGAKIGGLQNRSLFRKLGSFVFYISVLFLMGLRYVDYAPGAKAYRREFLLKHLKYIDDYTSFVLNLTFLAHVKKEPITEIPIACEDRRKSRFNLWREAVSKYRGLFSLKTAQLFGRL